MNGFVFNLIIGWLGLIGSSHTLFKLGLDNDNYYRAAKYSVPIDFSRSWQIMPEYRMPGTPSSIVSYQYFIQYGQNLIIEISDPGNEKKYLAVSITRLDYTKRESTFSFFLRNVRKYKTTIDTIAYSIEDSRGSTRDLCGEGELNARCDSVSFISASRNIEYTVFFNDTIANIPSIGLFYPDIKYLPSKIIREDCTKTIKTLDKVIYGKSAVDSLLSLFVYDGYDLITNEETNLIDTQFVKGLYEKLKCK